MRSLVGSPLPNLDYGFDTFESGSLPNLSPLPLEDELTDAYCQQCTVPPPLLDWDEVNFPMDQKSSPIVKNFVDLIRSESTPLLTAIVSPPTHQVHVGGKTTLVHDLCAESSPEMPTRRTDTLPAASSNKKVIVLSDDDEDSQVNEVVVSVSTEREKIVGRSTAVVVSDGSVQDGTKENRPSNTLTSAPSSPGTKRITSKRILKSKAIVLSDSEELSDIIDSPRTSPAKKSIAATTASKPRVQFDSPGSQSGGYSDTNLASIKKVVKTGSARKGRVVSAKGSPPVGTPKTPTRKVVVLLDSSGVDGSDSENSSDNSFVSSNLEVKERYSSDGSEGADHDRRRKKTAASTSTATKGKRSEEEDEEEEEYSFSDRDDSSRDNSSDEENYNTKQDKPGKKNRGGLFDFDFIDDEQNEDRATPVFRTPGKGGSTAAVTPSNKNAKTPASTVRSFKLSLRRLDVVASLFAEYNDTVSGDTPSPHFPALLCCWCVAACCLLLVACCFLFSL